MDGMIKNFIIMALILIIGIVLYNVLTNQGVDLCFPINGKDWCIN